MLLHKISSQLPNVGTSSPPEAVVEFQTLCTGPSKAMLAPHHVPVHVCQYANIVGCQGMHLTLMLPVLDIGRYDHCDYIDIMSSWPRFMVSFLVV